MKAGEAVSLQRMKAWWAYTEIRSPRLREEYRIDPRVPPLCAKIETVAFECLSAFEVNALAEIFETFRGSYLNHYWADVREFVIEEWSAEQLGRVLCDVRGRPLGRRPLPTIRGLCRRAPPDWSDCLARSAPGSRQGALDRTDSDTRSSYRWALPGLPGSHRRLFPRSSLHAVRITHRAHCGPGACPTRRVRVLDDGSRQPKTSVAMPRSGETLRVLGSGSVTATPPAPPDVRLACREVSLPCVKRNYLESSARPVDERRRASLFLFSNKSRCPIFALSPIAHLNDFTIELACGQCMPGRFE